MKFSAFAFALSLATMISTTALVDGARTVSDVGRRTKGKKGNGDASGGKKGNGDASGGKKGNGDASGGKKGNGDASGGKKGNGDASGGKKGNGSGGKKGKGSAKSPKGDIKPYRSLLEVGDSDTILYWSGDENDPGIGDHYIWSNLATDEYDEELKIQGSCHRVSVLGDHDWDCTFQYIFEHGKLFAQGGLGVEGGSVDNGITGGTGVYVGATGYITLFFPDVGDNLWRHELYVH